MLAGNIALIIPGRMEAQLFEKICEEIEESWEGLSIICPKHGIVRQTFYNHKDISQDNLDRYARARERQIDFLEDLLLKISMDSSKDFKTDENGNSVSNVVARARLQVDTIKFVLAKLRSNIWGAKVEHTIKSEPRIFNID